MSTFVYLHGFMSAGKSKKAEDFRKFLGESHPDCRFLAPDIPDDPVRAYRFVTDLLDGIGDTMRISLTGDPLREVLLAKDLLTACGKRRAGIDFISCPTCGRTQVDLPSIAQSIENALQPLSEQLAAEGRFIKVAVMGCAVNGPGEAREADYGVACGKGEGLLIAGGKQLKKVPEQEIIPQLLQLIQGGQNG